MYGNGRSTNQGFIGNINCLTNNSYLGRNNCSVGSALGLAFSSIAEANATKQQQINSAMVSGNHWALPPGTYPTSAFTEIKKGDGYVTYYNHQTKTHMVYKSDGTFGSFSG